MDPNRDDSMDVDVENSAGTSKSSSTSKTMEKRSSVTEGATAMDTVSEV